MATAGIFTLITNDGKQDRMLMATELLKRRLKSIKQARAAAGLKDTTPTLLDIERTHVLFMNAHFKPFAAIGFEYHKVNPDSGGATLGGQVRFSIPQFGDFFNDMALYCRFDQAVYTPTAVLDQNKDVFRYCDYPGERLLQNVKFDVNGNPLDEYDSTVYNFHRQFNVQPNKRAAWDRLVGQESPREAYLQQQSLVQPSSRVKLDVCDGYQTPKGTHKALAVMVPLLFWFNKDPRLAVPSVSIPYGQRFLNITLAKSSDLIELVTPPGAQGDAGVLPELKIAECSLFINNIFVNPEVHDIFIKRIGFTLIRVHRTQVSRQDKDNNNVLLNNMKWPIETLAVALKPVANTSHQTWHKFSKVTASTIDADGVASCKLNTAAQQEIDAMLAVALLAAPPATAAGQYALYAALTPVTAAGLALLSVASAAATAAGSDPASVHAAVQLASNTAYQTHATDSGSCAQVDLSVDTPTVDRLSITAHGIDIYKEMPGMFFNSYTPYTYGGHSVASPDDVGALLITFCLYPGSYQPSGHVNVSRAREFYLQYWSQGAVSNVDPADLIVVASAINFLLISDGSAVLRYST